jgi:hypothetical protein
MCKFRVVAVIDLGLYELPWEIFCFNFFKTLGGGGYRNRTDMRLLSEVFEPLRLPVPPTRQYPNCTAAVRNLTVSALILAGQFVVKKLCVVRMR